MVAAQPKLSRRALLGAAFAPVAFSRHPGLDPGSISFAAPLQEEGMPDRVRHDEAGQAVAAAAWYRALTRFRRAEAALTAAAHAPDDVHDPLGARHHLALSQLLHTPAPDLAALARKLDLALDERSGEFAGDAAAMRALKQDAHRLAGSPA